MLTRYNKVLRDSTKNHSMNQDLEHVSSPYNTIKVGQRFIGSNLNDMLSPTSWSNNKKAVRLETFSSEKEQSARFSSNKKKQIREKFMRPQN